MVSQLSEEAIGHQDKIEKLEALNLKNQTINEEKDVKIEELEGDLAHFEDIIENKQSEINSLEIKKMARAFGNQENSYSTSVLGWLGAVIFIWFIFILVHVALIFEHLSWIDHLIQG